MLVFTAREAFLHCPNGILTESICLGDDSNESIRLESVHNIRLCDFLHRQRLWLKTPTPHIATRRLQYKVVFLALLQPYMRRVLSYDTDALSAYSGIVKAQSRILGPFHWGLPLALFARALLLMTPGGTTIWSRRPGFPSWSWLGWKFNCAARDMVEDVFDLGQSLQILVHIYASDEKEQLTLLYGQRNDRNGTEGFCSRCIDTYNALASYEPLPLMPSIMGSAPRSSAGVAVSQMLCFWSHVARFEPLVSPLRFSLQFEGTGASRVDHEEAETTVIEIALIAMSNAPAHGDQEDAGGIGWHEEANRYIFPWEERYSGIIIERKEGYARRLGVAHAISRKEWLSGSPKKELVSLI